MAREEFELRKESNMRGIFIFSVFIAIVISASMHAIPDLGAIADAGTRYDTIYAIDVD